MAAEGSGSPGAQPDWGSLPGDVLGRIGGHVCPVSMACARLACKHWAQHIGSTVEAFKPHALELSMPADQYSWRRRLAALRSCFPLLTEITVGRCSRNNHYTGLHTAEPMSMQLARMKGLHKLVCRSYRRVRMHVGASRPIQLDMHLVCLANGS